MQYAAHRGNYRACSGRYEPRPGSGDVIAERGAMTSQKQPKKSPGRGPKGKNRHNMGRPQTPEGEDCKHRGVAGYGGKENRRSLRSCGGGGGCAKCDENNI